MADSIKDFETDELIAELEARGVVNAHHTVELRIADFSMKHTMRCQPDLFNCDIHKEVEAAYLKTAGLCPWKPGTYKVQRINKKLKLEVVK